MYTCACTSDHRYLSYVYLLLFVQRCILQLYMFVILFWYC